MDAPQLAQLVEKAPSGAQWLHKINLDGYRMAARIERGEVKLLTRTGPDRSAPYPGMSTARGRADEDRLSRR